MSRPHLSLRKIFARLFFSNDNICVGVLTRGKNENFLKTHYHQKIGIRDVASQITEVPSPYPRSEVPNYCSGTTSAPLKLSTFTVKKWNFFLNVRSFPTILQSGAAQTLKGWGTLPQSFYQRVDLLVFQSVGFKPSLCVVYFH